MPKLTDRAWSPYVAGILIGLLQIPAFLAINTAIGASSSYVTVVGNLCSLIDPDVASWDYVAKHLSGPKNWWQVALIVGVGFGAYLSSRLSGMRRQGFSPAWSKAVGIRSLAGRMAMGFAGGFLLLLGSRIADGCTSGHGISGMAQLAAGSTIAVVAMFAGGILTATLFRRI